MVLPFLINVLCRTIFFDFNTIMIFNTEWGWDFGGFLWGGWDFFWGERGVDFLVRLFWAARGIGGWCWKNFMGWISRVEFHGKTSRILLWNKMKHEHFSENEKGNTRRPTEVKNCRLSNLNQKFKARPSSPWQDNVVSWILNEKNQKA